MDTYIYIDTDAALLFMAALTVALFTSIAAITTKQSFSLKYSSVGAAKSSKSR